MLSGMDLIMTSTANDDEVLRNVISAMLVMLQMMQLENSRVFC